MDFQTLMGFVPIPNILESKKVLFIGPHPDDIEVGCGGLVSEFIDLNTRVRFLIVTDGGAGSFEPNSIEKTVEIRKEESKVAGEFLGIEKVEVLDFPDGGIYSIDKMAVEIAKRIIGFKPDTVICPDPLLETETHPDHINCAKATQKAMLISKFPNAAIRNGLEIDKNTIIARGMNLVYYYTSRPNTIIPIQPKNFDKKIEAIMKHKSQIDQGFDSIKMYLYYKATSLGMQVGSKYAEGYFAMSPAHQHCFLEKI